MQTISELNREIARHREAHSSLARTIRISKYMTPAKRQHALELMRWHSVDVRSIVNSLRRRWRRV
jgi:hypothetical protein